MALAMGYSSIVSCPVAGRNLVLFYNVDTGATLVGALHGQATLTVLKTYTFSKGWTQVVWSSGRVLFYNEYTGLAAIGAFDVTGAFTQSASLPPNVLGPGWVNVVSAADNVWLHRLEQGWDIVGRLTPTGIANVSQDAAWHWRDGRAWMVAERDIVVSFSVDYRVDATIGILRLDHDGGLHGLYPYSQSDPNWTTVLPSNGFLLYYDDGVGGGKIVEPDGYKYDLDRLPWTPATISSSWTHLTAIGQAILFYAQYDGSAAVGSIGLGGVFSGETALTVV